ncbi:MAG TPA: PH domain-containing protein [Candidatus Saccharimonadia bacterium]|nr:PH domain-containing protein [Candidatus Saccharimonadia bacterium]
MQVTPRSDTILHQKLPIDADEKILAIYKHHWFAYAANWLVSLTIAIALLVLAIVLTTIGGADGTLVQYRYQIIAVASVFSILVLAGTCVPIYLRSQEQVVLTEEAIVQILRPSLFANKIDQLSLRHISDVSVTQDFLGTMFGFGHITIETPGEQNNYHFSTLTNPHEVAREIIAAHENFDAAVHSGRMPTTIEKVAQPQPPVIDSEQYQQFLQYQQMVARQQQEQQQAGNQPFPPTQPNVPNETTQPPQDPVQR